MAVKADEKSKNKNLVCVPALSRWLKRRLSSVIWASSTPLPALWKNNTGCSASSTFANSMTLNNFLKAFITSEVRATGLRSFKFWWVLHQRMWNDAGVLYKTSELVRSHFSVGIWPLHGELLHLLYICF